MSSCSSIRCYYLLYRGFALSTVSGPRYLPWWYYNCSNKIVSAVSCYNVCCICVLNMWTVSHSNCGLFCMLRFCVMFAFFSAGVSFSWGFVLLIFYIDCCEFVGTSTTVCLLIPVAYWVRHLNLLSHVRSCAHLKCNVCVKVEATKLLQFYAKLLFA